MNPAIIFLGGGEEAVSPNNWPADDHTLPGVCGIL